MARLSIPVHEVNSFDLPKVCVITGATQDVGFHPVKFSWYPRWIAIFAPFALLPVAILALILTKRVKGELPFTQDAFARWRRGQLLFTLSLVSAIVMIVASFPVTVATAGPDWVPLGFLIGLVLGIFEATVIWFVALKPWHVKVVQITTTHLTVDVPSAEAAMQITRHLLSGEKRTPAAAAPETPNVRAIG